MRMIKGVPSPSVRSPFETHNIEDQSIIKSIGASIMMMMMIHA
jgi:hypothetical protein